MPHTLQVGGGGGGGDMGDEAPKDPRIYRTRPSFCETDFGAISPAKYVQTIIGENTDAIADSHPLFLEMEELATHNDVLVWKETARWVKFEENVEVGGNRWSKPHVGTLSLHSLFEVRSFLLNNTVIMNLDGLTFDSVADQIVDRMISTGHLPSISRHKVKETLMRPHKHLHQKKSGSKRGSSMKRSSKKINNPQSSINKPPKKNLNEDHTGREESPFSQDSNEADETDVYSTKGNSSFMRKIPPDAEACNILVGAVDFLEKPVSAFVRLSEATVFDGLTEVPVPTRFMFILLGPMEGRARYHEVGRAMATLLSDEVFHDVAYLAKNRGHLLAGADEFLDAVTVLPPAKWDPSIRIEPPAAIPSQDPRKQPKKPDLTPMDEERDEEKLREESGLVRSGRLFGGLINDVKRKKPWYWSDFTDGLAIQCIASSIFLYLGCLTPIITFGGLLGKATHYNMAAMESLVSGFVCGVVYGLFSGQPLTILGSTGPVLVFETVVVNFCDAYELDYLELRLWIGIWMTLVLIVLVALDASAFVCYITRFTEENFACLIALIFIVEAFKNVAEIQKTYPVNPNTETHADHSCECQPGNGSLDQYNGTVNWGRVTFDECEKPPFNGTLVGGGCGYYPDVFFLSTLLFLGTFFISITLKNFKFSTFFPSKVRQLVSDFAVILAIISMTCVDMLIGLRTPKLEVPETFAPTLPTRSWLIHPIGKNPTWAVFGAILPALLATILIFMDQQITAVIVNRKEHKLRKGCGYHLDLLILSVLILICSFLGIPWFAAATVRAMNHVDSLKMESKCAAPGERPQFLGVREQRVTQIVIAVLIGLSVPITPVLRNIPMPVLYGVFLYMGITGLKGMQFFDRILIMLMPLKYQPDYKFLREVPLLRVHAFTLIQLSCLVGLWLIKSFKSTSILFPLMLVVMMIVRKLLDFVFTQRELKCLDDIMPGAASGHRGDGGTKENGKMDFERDILMDGVGFTKSTGSIPRISLTNENLRKISLASMNLTEELNKTGIWRQINKDNRKESIQSLTAHKKPPSAKRQNSRDAITDDERTYLAVMTEVEENDGTFKSQNSNVA